MKIFKKIKAKRKRADVYFSKAWPQIFILKYSRLSIGIEILVLTTSLCFILTFLIEVLVICKAYIDFGLFL